MTSAGLDCCLHRADALETFDGDSPKPLVDLDLPDCPLVNIAVTLTEHYCN